MGTMDPFWVYKGACWDLIAKSLFFFSFFLFFFYISGWVRESLQARWRDNLSLLGGENRTLVTGVKGKGTTTRLNHDCLIARSFTFGKAWYGLSITFFASLKNHWRYGWILLFGNLVMLIKFGLTSYVYCCNFLFVLPSKLQL